MKKVYIAGPMTGRELYNFPAFDNAAAQWRDAGWWVISPAELTRDYWRAKYGQEFDPANGDPSIQAGGDVYREFLRGDIAAIAHCDAIALLPGWERSRGVAAELTVARLLKLEEYNAVTFSPMETLSETALQEAQRLVHGDRGASYGHPTDDYTATGRMWGATLDRWLRSIGFALPERGIPDIDPRVCCLMMAAVKISREAGKSKRDNRVDLAGYAECADMVAQRQRA